MALLNKLSYYGIRSVPGDSKDQIFIEFESPLTIIWGPNGSGKTTLIEALKFVTANEAPPGDKQAFIHNLKIARSPRVDARIMLEFMNEKKKKVTVTKRFNAVATAKTKTGTQFKSDESTIDVRDDLGKVAAISSKNADFQAEVLSHLGVPAAILSNVIFCHQEDSCWPLSEPKELKTRFDKIFQLQKFTKAIEQAKKIKKEQMTRLKVLKSETEHHSLLLKTKGKALKEKNETKEAWLANAKVLEELDARIEQERTEIRSLDNELKEMEQKLGRRDIIEAELGVYTKNVRSFDAQGIQAFNGTWEELQDEKKAILEQLDKEGQQDCVRDLQQIQRQLEQRRAERDRCQTQLNELVRKRENFQKMKENVAEVQQEICRKFPFCGFDPQRMAAMIPAVLAERRRLLEEAKGLHSGKRSSLQQECDEAVAAVSRARADMCFMDQNKQKAMREIREIEAKFAAIEGSNRREYEINRRLSELDLMSQGLPALDENRSRELQEKRTQLRQELVSLREKADLVAKFEQETKERRRIETEVDAAEKRYQQMVDKHRKDMTVLFGETPDSLWGSSVRDKKRQLDMEMQAVSEKKNKLEFNVRSERAVYEEKKREEEKLEEQIESTTEAIEAKCGCLTAQLKGEHSKVAEELKKARKELAPLNTKADLYETWISETTEKSCCPLCERKFTGKAGASSLVQKLNDMTLSLPDDIDRLTQRVAQLELKEGQLTEAMGEADRLTNLQRTLEEFRERKERARSQQEEYECSLKTCTAEYEKVKETHEAVTRISADLSLVDSLYTSFKTKEKELATLPAVQNGSTTSVETVRLQIGERETALRGCEAEMEKVDTAKQRKNGIDNESIALRQELVQLSEFGGQRAALEEQLREKRTYVEDLENQSKMRACQLPALEENIQKTRSLRETAEADFTRLERGGDAEIRDLEGYQRNLVEKETHLDEMHVADSQLEDVKRQLRRLEAEFNDLLVRQTNAESNNSRLDKIVEKRKYIERQIDLYELNKRIRELQKEVEELALPSKEHIREIRGEYDKKISRMNQDCMKKSNLDGQQSEIKRKNKEVSKTLAEDAIQTAEVTFRNTLIDKNICEKIIEDLDSFVTVLDTSILKFHKDKMSAINVILDDLWRKVYNGVDIETIKIKTETNASGDKRASYDYNVVMVLEGGVEVGMRDRCSAGQKMLASLLIRIALADVFAKTCSIIALDEPTTNLDTAKIEQMSAMLNTLIAARRADDRHGHVQGKQFQMIVITHDERLVNSLKLGCRPGRTFKISKDPLSGKSRLDAYDYAGNKVD